jgi:hypothetical protein
VRARACLDHRAHSRVCPHQSATGYRDGLPFFLQSFATHPPVWHQIPQSRLAPAEIGFQNEQSRIDLPPRCPSRYRQYDSASLRIPSNDCFAPETLPGQLLPMSNLQRLIFCTEPPAVKRSEFFLSLHRSKSIEVRDIRFGRCVSYTAPRADEVSRMIHFAAAYESGSDRYCCKSLFALLIKNSPGCRRDFPVKMWGPHRLTLNSRTT